MNNTNTSASTDNPDGIIERLDRPDSPEELAYRNVSGPDDNLVKGPPIGSGQPGDAGGPDIWSNDSGPLQAPRNQDDGSESARNRAAPGTMGIPGIDGQGGEGLGAPGTPQGDQGYVSSGGGLGGGSTVGAGVNTSTPTTGSQGNMSNTGGTRGVSGTASAGNRPTPEDVAQPSDLQPRSQANASSDATMPASMGTGTAGTSIGTTNMGQSRPAGPQLGSATANRTGEVGTASAISSGSGIGSGTQAGAEETGPGEINQFNVPGGTGPTNAEMGDVGIPSAQPHP